MTNRLMAAVALQLTLQFAPACGDGGSLSPQELGRTLAGSFWSYEKLTVSEDGRDAVSEASSYWFGEDARFEHYLSGFEPIQTGTWEVDGSGNIALAYDGGTGSTATLLVKTSSEAAMTLEAQAPFRPQGETVERRFRRSERCPEYLSRYDGRYFMHFLGLATPATERVGAMAVDFDSGGELHILAARFVNQQEGFYATSRGARCGLRVFGFEAQAGARLVIGPDDTIHAAYVVGTSIRYASRPALADPSVPWQVTEVGANTFVSPEVSLALAKDGSVAIAAGGDQGDYRTFKSSDPGATAPDWQVSTLPVTVATGSELIFGVSVAFDPSSRLHVAATPDGANVVVLRDDGGAWTSFDVPRVEPLGSFFEGPSSFAIADDGRWLLAAGSIGTPDSQAGPGRPGALALGTGTSEDFAWTTIGAGGRAVLDLEKSGVLHIASADRVLGGLHTVVDADGEVVERYHANALISTFDRTALATGPQGEVAIANYDSVQVLPQSGQLEPMLEPLQVELKDPAGAAVVLPELDERCTDSCTFDVVKGRWLAWEVERSGGRTPSLAASTFCRGAELTGACWVFADNPECQFAREAKPTQRMESGQCSAAIDLTFVPADVTAFIDPVTADMEVGSWSPYGPVAHDGQLALVMTLVGTSTPSRLVRWDPATRRTTSTPLTGWSRADGLVSAANGLVLFGSTDTTTTLGTESGFGGERVAVGVSPAGEVTWVTRLDASALATGMVPLADGFAVPATTGLFRYRADGSLVGPANAVGVANFKAARLLGGGTTADLIGPVVYDSAASPYPRSVWLRYGANGILESQTDIPATVVSALRTTDGSVLMAVLVAVGQSWGGKTVTSAGWALARYSASGALIDAGTVLVDGTLPDSPTQWARQMDAGAALRADGRLVFALETALRQTVVFELGAEDVESAVTLGGQGLGGTSRQFTPTGVAAAGDAVYLGGIANGRFQFPGAERIFNAPTATLVEVP